MSQQLPKYRLLKDLYAFNTTDTDLAYRLFTGDELKKIVAVVHAVGGIYEFDESDGAMHGPDGTVGVDGSPDPGCWEPYSAQDYPCGPEAVYELFAPNGTRIIGTFEKLRGVAVVTGASGGGDDGLELQYEGTTDVWWNDQRTAREAGERLFVDADDCVWRESQLMLEPVPEVKEHLPGTPNFEETPGENTHG